MTFPAHTQGNSIEFSVLPVLRRLVAGGVSVDDLRKHRFQPHEFLCRTGEQLDRLHIIEKGIVELCRFEAGEECAVLLLATGDVIFPAAGLFSEPCLASARALTLVKTTSVPCEAVRTEARTDPELAVDLSRAMGGQWRMAVRHILDLKCRSAPQRLASFLLRLADESAIDSVAELPFSKGALAARIGVSRETLSRAIQTVAEHGLLLRGRQIVVRDRAAAVGFCAPNPYPGSDEHSLNVHAL